MIFVAKHNRKACVICTSVVRLALPTAIALSLNWGHLIYNGTYIYKWKLHLSFKAI